MCARRLGLLSAAGLLAGFGVAAPAHAAANLACGQTVTSSVTLSADIGPCAGDGLVVHGSGISVNLAGHTIRGSGDLDADQVGVRVVDSSNVSVSTGTVTAFNAGVALENTTGSTIRAIRAMNNKSLGTSNHGDGIVLDGSSGNRLEGNDVAGNGPFSGITMVDGADNNLIRGNSIHDNTLVRAEPLQVAPRQENVGVRFDTGASHNTIDGNRILGNGSEGVNASRATGGPASSTPAPISSSPATRSPTTASTSSRCPGGPSSPPTGSFCSATSAAAPASSRTTRSAGTPMTGSASGRSASRSSVSTTRRSSSRFAATPP